MRKLHNSPADLRRVEQAIPALATATLTSSTTDIKATRDKLAAEADDRAQSDDSG